VSLLTDVVNSADVGVVQCGGRLRFPLKPGKCLRVLRHIVSEEFQRNVAVQPRIFGFVHDAHPAAAKFLEDAVVGDGLADEGVGIRHSAAILGCVLRLSQRIGANRGESGRL